MGLVTMSPPTDLMPHAVCWASAPRLVWTMVVTNFITFVSYSVICTTLLLLARRTRRVIARDWAYFVVGFALFIVACGSTHLLEVITTWTPIFWVDAWTNIVTAALSATVALMLIRRAAVIGFGINDYAARLSATEGEKQRLERSLLSAQKLEDWSRMSTVVAHEIINPLEAIQNLLYLIRTTEGISPEVVELAQTAAEEGTRVATISRSTLSFFRESTQPETIDLGAAAESLRFLLHAVLKQSGIVLEIAGTGNLAVEAFPGETRQVLLNLVRNACEATTGRGATVRISLTGEAGGVRIVIADEGTGIDPKVLPLLFQFGVSSKGAKGNGMGLWTVQQIVTKHGGTIEVASTPEEGTRFTIWWPREYAVVGTGTQADSRSRLLSAN